MPINLEYTTHLGNIIHANDMGLVKSTGLRMRPVIQYDLNGNEINRFASIKEIHQKLVYQLVLLETFVEVILPW